MFQKYTKKAATIFFIASVLVLPEATNASAMVSEISGKDYKITRGKYSIKANKLDILEPGDTISVLLDTEISLVLEGRRLNLNSKNTPYVVPESSGKGIFSNAIRVAVSKFRDMLNRTTSTQVLISRGTNQSPKIKSIEPGVNYIPRDIKSLRLFFESSSLSRVSLTGGNVDSELEIQFSGDMVGIPLTNLPTGRYILQVLPMVSQTPIETKIILEIVPEKAVPTEVKNVIANYNSPVREQLAAILLSEKSGWRLAATQYAFDANQFDILETILETNASLTK